MKYGKKNASAKQKALSTKSGMKKRRLGVVLFKSILLTLLAAFAITVVVGIVFIKKVLDQVPEDIDVEPKEYATTVYDNEGTEITKLVSTGSNRVFTDIDDIPLHLQHAFVAIEDERFYEHNGIDFRGITRAVVKGIKEQNFSEGASTITQQLIKNNIFTNFMEEDSITESLKRKIQEQYIAIKVEKTLDKDTILQHYLNSINLGQNTLGVQAASVRYFGKDVSEITLSESAVIAAITQNPTKYNPVTHPEQNATRRTKVLDHMLEQGYITQEEYDTALTDNVYDRIQQVNEQYATSPYSYYVDELIKQLKDDLIDAGYSETNATKQIYSGGLSIYSAQDPEIQAICDGEFSDPNNYPSGTLVELNFALTVKRADGTTDNYDQNSMKNFYKDGSGTYNMKFSSQEKADAAYETYKGEALNMQEGDVIEGESLTYVPQPQASMVIIDHSTGLVPAIVGGRGEKKESRSFNRATDSTRQPGSTFKVLSTYAPALDNAGMTLASVQYDCEYYYTDGNGEKVNNWYSSGYKGYCTLRYGIEQSLNIVAVKTLTEVGPQTGYDYLMNMGFDSSHFPNTDARQTMALGGLSYGVTNLELTAGFATIANGGTYIKPRFYTKVIDHNGNVLIDNEEDSKQVLKESTAALLTSAMEDVVTKGTGTAVQLSDMPVAGKTGTTTKDKDVWFSGYTPYYTCSIWGGYDDSTPLPKGSTNFHKTLWKKIMTRVHEDLPTQNFTLPSSITTAKVCKKSGQLAVEGVCDADPRGNMITTEYFAAGTAPTDYCSTHQLVTLCSASSMRASDFCPHIYRTTQSRVILPDDALGHTDDSNYAVPSYCTQHTSAADSYIPDIGLEDEEDDSGNEDNPTDSGESETPPEEDTGIFPFFLRIWAPKLFDN